MICHPYWKFLKYRPTCCSDVLYLWLAGLELVKERIVNLLKHLDQESIWVMVQFARPKIQNNLASNKSSNHTSDICEFQNISKSNFFILFLFSFYVLQFLPPAFSHQSPPQSIAFSTDSFLLHFPNHDFALILVLDSPLLLLLTCGFVKGPTMNPDLCHSTLYICSVFINGKLNCT